VRHAALINATASHTVEFDDIFRDAGYHPGCPVIAEDVVELDRMAGGREQPGSSAANQSISARRA
jgi:hypothetical protein